MKSYGNAKQSFYAWMLLLALIPMTLVKTFHIHFCDTPQFAVQCDEGQHHSSSSCPICKFVLSPFIDASPVIVDYVCHVSSRIYDEPLIDSERVYISRSVLRAPPAVIKH